MVLEHVPQDPGGLVITRAGAHPQVLRGRDLHVIHVAAVPNGFKDRIGETHDQKVLHRFLAQVMVDAVDLAFLEDFLHFAVEFFGRSQVVPEGFLDDHPGEPLLLPGQSRRAQVGNDVLEDVRGGGKVKDAVPRRSIVLVHPVQAAGQGLEDLGVVIGTGHVMEILGETVPKGIRKLGLALFQSFLEALLEILVGDLGARDADKAEGRGQKMFLVEVEKSGYQFTVG